MSIANRQIRNKRQGGKTMASTSSPSTASGAVALLDLPLRSVVGVDGHVIVLQRDDFVGIHGFPSDGNFHLVTTRSSAGTAAEKQNLSAITCGFVLLPLKESDWIVARKYNAQTEEVSAAPLDSRTTENLVAQVKRGRMQQRVIPYDSILPESEIEIWKKQTKYISGSLLEKRGLCHGDKVVPGCYEDDDTETSAAKNVDGKSIEYPPIPVLDDTSKLKRTSHAGTKRYLAQLSPSDRTALFLDDAPSDRAFSDILVRYYDNRWQELLGDIQLSYTMFLHIQCLASLEHWRDLVAMTSTVDLLAISQHMELFVNLLKVLETQIVTMEKDFFEDIEFSADSFFIPSITRLCFSCSKSDDDRMVEALASLKRALQTQFPGFLANDGNTRQENHDPTNEDVDMMGESGGGDVVRGGESDDEGDPVVVSNDELQAFLARLAQKKSGPNSPLVSTEYSKQEREAYPLLFAAKQGHEDVLMACARILDEKNDVSLVREAAAYLEEVEAKR